MHLRDGLEQLETQLREEADRAGLPCVPALPNGPGWEVDWPDPDGVMDFVATASAAGARLLYLEAPRAHDELFEAPAAAEAIAQHRGEVASVQAAWVVEGVVHRLGVLATWVDAAAAAEDLHHDLDQHDQDARLDQMARVVVDDPAFQLHSGPRDDAKYAAIDTAFPDLDRGTRFQLLHRANSIDVAERKPAREAAWAARARELLEDGATKRGAAEQLGISVNVLNRVLQQNPP